MWHFMCDALIKAIGTEPDSDVLSEIMHAFAKVTSAGLFLLSILPGDLKPEQLGTRSSCLFFILLNVTRVCIYSVLSWWETAV